MNQESRGLWSNKSIYISLKKLIYSFVVGIICVGGFSSDSVYALESFENLYDRVYTLSDKKQDTLVCNRLQQRKQLWYNDRDIEFADFKCSEAFLLEKGGLDAHIKNITKDKTSHTKWIKRVTDTMQFERDLLQFEDDLRELNGNQSYFADRSMAGEAHSLIPTFDLIKDLDDIDEVLFGEKHTRPEPGFSFQESSEFIETEEGWQDGTSESGCESGFCLEVSLSTNVNDYGEDKSIAGTIAHMKQVYADGKGGAAPLSGISQMAECTSTRFFEQTILDGFKLRSVADLNSIVVEKSPTKMTKPEVKTNAQEKIDKKTKALEKKILTETSCQDKVPEDTKNDNMINSGIGEAIAECQTLNNEFWEQRIDAINKDGVMAGEKAYFQRILRAIDQFNNDLESWYYQIVEHKKEYKLLSEKPKCW